MVEVQPLFLVYFLLGGNVARDAERVCDGELVLDLEG